MKECTDRGGVTRQNGSKQNPSNLQGDNYAVVAGVAALCSAYLDRPQLHATPGRFDDTERRVRKKKNQTKTDALIMQK